MADDVPIDEGPARATDSVEKTLPDRPNIKIYTKY